MYAQGQVESCKRPGYSSGSRVPALEKSDQVSTLASAPAWRGKPLDLHARKFPDDSNIGSNSKLSTVICALT
jgi:hypothetical protein